MRMRVHRYATIFSCYAPTLLGTEEDKDSFYECLDAELQRVPRSDKIIMLGDFNARVGSSYFAWRGVIGHHGLGKANSNGHRLLSLCASHHLVITNMIFAIKDIYKGTWQQPCSKLWHTLHYVVVRQRDRNDVNVTRAMRGAECWTDHRLVRSKMLLCIRLPVRKRAPNRKLNCTSLNTSEVRQDLSAEISRRLTNREPREVYANRVEEIWSVFAGVVTEAAGEVLGYTKHRNKNWFDNNNAEIHRLLEERNRAHGNFLRNPSSIHLKRTWQEKHSEAQRSLRVMENAWWLDISPELRRHADAGDQQNFYSCVKRIYGRFSKTLDVVRSEDGSILITDKGKILDRWREHYEHLLNTRHPCSPELLDQITIRPSIYAMGITPALEEVKSSILSLKNGKSPGVDGIPGEVIKYGGDELWVALHNLIIEMWENEQVLQQWKDTRIISIHKGKGDRAVCGNNRGISLLAVAGKVLAKILLMRLNRNIVDKVCPETQCGFRSERGTIDMVFTARQLQEKSREQERNLCMAFIDLSKAFDTVNRDLLWLVLGRFGCPDKFVAMARAFHVDMRASVVVGGEETVPFSVELGVKQGCVMAPVLFNLYLAAATEIFHNRIPTGHGIDISYRLDRSLFNLRRLQARTKVSHVEVFVLQYADDCVLVSNCPENLQDALNSIYDIFSSLGLAVNASKTELLYQWTGVEPAVVPIVAVGGSELKVSSQINYLGTILMDSCSSDADVDRRINRAHVSFGRIRQRVIQNHNLLTSTKVSVYRALCLSVLLYGCETLTLYRKHSKLLETFHMHCIKTISGLSWRDRVKYTNILERADISSIECIPLGRQMRWAGHVLRMPESRLPRRVLYGQLSTGTRARGGPKKRYKDQLRRTLSAFDISPQNFEAVATDRAEWRAVCHRGALHFEANLTAQRNDKRRRRHERALQPPPPPDPDLRCTDCGRQCGSRIGLYSHRRTHRRQPN